jgi:hypothetical protein
VIASVSLGLRETLAKERRRPFAWKGTSPLAFTRLFGRGALSAKLNAVVLLQSLTNGMGDLWQVLARELRGWGASQCGNFAAIAGLATMGGTLLTGPSIRRFGARGHTVASTMSSAVASVVLGHATSNAIAFSGVVLLFAKDLERFGDGALGWALLALASPLVSCVGTTLVKRYGTRINSLQLNRNAMAVGAAWLVLLAVVYEREAPATWSPRASAEVARHSSILHFLVRAAVGDRF